MTEKIYQKVFNEIGDQISSEVRSAVRHIDANLDKIASLDAIVEQMQEADEADIFRLVPSLPTTGKSGEYYIVLNTTTHKYEEYTWNGTSYDKIGLIGDEIYPTLDLTSVFHLVSRSSSGYASANPSSEHWYAEDPETHQIVESQDAHTWSSLDFSAVNKSGEGYSSKNPVTEGWYEYADDEYTPSQDTTVDDGKTYYTATEVYTKDYFQLVAGYKQVSDATAGYSSMNPKALDWYEYDDISEQYSPTVDKTPQLNKSYYVAVS
jgi:hypothetical protein